MYGNNRTNTLFRRCKNDAGKAKMNVKIEESDVLEEGDFQRPGSPCDSLHEAPPLVPTSPDALIGPNIRDGGHYQRIAVLKRRTEVALDAVGALLRSRPKEPDGDEEFERSRTRISEFLSRFSRNYLFQLRMQVTELQRHFQGSSLDSCSGHGHTHAQQQLLFQKLVAAHQTVVQGLQACLHQLPGAVHDSAILNKLDQLICHVCELTSLETEFDCNANPTISGYERPRQTIKIKAQNLLQLIRKKRKEGEESHLAWKRTAAVLAKNRFGPPPGLTRTRAVSRPTSKEAKPKLAERRAKRPGVNKQAPPASRTEIRRTDEFSTQRVSTIDLPEEQAEAVLPNTGMDPAAALELKIIMSRMKDILRGANAKSSSQPKDTYPPNVRLVCLKYSEDNIPTAHEGEDDTKPPGQRDACEVSDPAPPDDECDAAQMQGGEQSREEDLTELQQHQVEQDTQQSEEPSNRPDAYPIRRLTPEELTFIRYRNQFNMYKQHVGEVQEICERVLSTVFLEVAKELEPSILLDQMYYLELKD